MPNAARTVNVEDSQQRCSSSRLKIENIQLQKNIGSTPSLLSDIVLDSTKNGRAPSNCYENVDFGSQLGPRPPSLPYSNLLDEGIVWEQSTKPMFESKFLHQMLLNTRKDYTIQNVLPACTFDLKFTYVLAGWEGTTSDVQILKAALRRQYGLKIPHGKYYIGDALFPIMSGLIPPYRGERYHLKEHSHNPPRSPRELFNLRHSYLRNAIERIFDVVKKRFPIIASANEPHYDVYTHTRIILACCIVHNFLMVVDPDETIIKEVDQELADGDDGECENRFDDLTEEGDAARGEFIRSSTAVAMWRDYNP